MLDRFGASTALRTPGRAVEGSRTAIAASSALPCNTFPAFSSLPLASCGDPPCPDRECRGGTLVGSKGGPVRNSAEAGIGTRRDAATGRRFL